MMTTRFIEMCEIGFICFLAQRLATYLSSSIFKKNYMFTRRKYLWYLIYSLSLLFHLIYICVKKYFYIILIHYAFSLSYFI